MENMSKKTKIWFLALGMFLCANQVHADYTIQTSTESNSIAAFGDDAGDIVFVQKFSSIGAGTVTTGTVNLSYGESETPPDHLTCSIVEDSTGPFGTVLGTSNNFDSTTAYPIFTDEEFTFSSAVSLDATTDYWLLCERTGSANPTHYYVYAGEAVSTSPPSQTCATGPSSCSANKKTANIAIYVSEGGPIIATSTELEAFVRAYNQPLGGMLAFMFVLAALTFWVGLSTEIRGLVKKNTPR